MRCHRADDFSARLGGDEFVVLATTNGGDSGAEEALRARLEAATRGRFDLEGVSIDYGGASVGVITAAHDTQDVDAELARADAAMYAVKRARNQGRH